MENIVSHLSSPLDPAVIDDGWVKEPCTKAILASLSTYEYARQTERPNSSPVDDVLLAAAPR